MNGGKGILLGGVTSVIPAKVVIIGGGVVGTHAAHIAMGMGADTWAIDRSAEALKALWRQFGRPLDTVYSTRTAIDRHVTDADVVIGGVLVPGAAAPKLVTADMIRRHEAAARWSSMSPSTRAAASRPRIRRPTAIPPHRRRGGPLLRREHARRGAPDLHVRAQQRDPAPRAHPREQGLPPGAHRRSAPPERPQRARRGSRAGRSQTPSATSTVPRSKRSPRSSRAIAGGVRERRPGRPDRTRLAPHRSMGVGRPDEGHQTAPPRPPALCAPVRAPGRRRPDHAPDLHDRLASTRQAARGRRS